ncbi:response regulator [Qipengyuania zhejiangensis]|uniref:response regulator n=1 Tax=Qipengyuania zhejiangensis TaxID=3077782 RepID=UPI002D79BED4|nr:response regulator [Qipengyuania sp. Z2]
MKILIVEDEALTAMSMQAILEDNGHTVVDIADDGASALRAAERERPQLAFVDIQLAGGESGIDVASRLREMGIPVLFSTGNCPGPKGANLAIGCLHKPVSEEQLAGSTAVAEAVIRSAPPPSPPPGMHLYI